MYVCVCFVLFLVPFYIKLRSDVIFSFLFANKEQSLASLSCVHKHDGLSVFVRTVYLPKQ